MNNIEQYKKRFYNLMESTMGDVKPLINEQLLGGFGGENDPLYATLFSNEPSSNLIKQTVENCNRSQSQPNNISDTKADQIRNSIQGLGTNLNTIYGVINSLKSISEFCSVCKSYQNSYNTSLFEDLDGDIDMEGEWTPIMKKLRDMANAEKTHSSQRPTQPQTRPTQQTGPGPI